MPEHPQFYGKHLRYMGMAQIIMQENYIAMFDAPQAAQAEPAPPLNNIHLENGKPVWDKNCTHCIR